MAANVVGDRAKLEEISKKNYKAQAIWFLNANWLHFGDKAEEEGERLWNFVHKCQELDFHNKEEGCELDELNAHRFLEAFNETMTVRAMRTRMRKTGAVDEKYRFKMNPLIHVLIFRYKSDWQEIVNASQGDNSEAIAEAERRLAAVTAAFEECKAKDQQAQQSLQAAKAREAEAKAAEAQAVADEQAAKAREAEAKASKEAAEVRETQSKAAAAESKQREAELEVARRELEEAVAEVKRQEDAYNAKTEDLKRKSETGGVVSRNRAKNELAQHLGEDPLPLRRAKLTAEAALRKADKAKAVASVAAEAAEAAANEATEARAAAEAAAAQATQARAAAEQARASAEQARASAEQARQASEEAKAAAEAALAEALRQVAEAEEFLAVEKAKPGVAHGAIWWLERELYEQKKYLPESKGGIRR